MSTPAHTPSATPILSTYTGDPDMLDLIRLYVDELPERVKTVQDFWERNDLHELRRIAHQIKGASGGYGFPTVGAAAGALEHHLTSTTSPDHSAVSRQIEALIDLCARVRVA